MFLSEVLIDTGRHFIPKLTLYQIIDSMTYSKINVMHWYLDALLDTRRRRG